MQPDTKEENMFFPDGNTLILNEQEQKQCEGFLTARKFKIDGIKQEPWK